MTSPAQTEQQYEIPAVPDVRVDEENDSSAVSEALELARGGGLLPSPTDLDVQKARPCTTLSPLRWHHWDLPPAKMRATNSGCTVMLSGKWRLRERPHLTGGPLQGRYVFSQLHFHWGELDTEGSEHTLVGKSFPLEMHMVLFKTRYLTQEAALKETDGVVEVAYLFQLNDKDNPLLEPAVRALRKVACPLRSHRMEPVPLSQLVASFPTDYLLYVGSLMAGQCTHTVTWVVQHQPLAVSKRQVAAFRGVYGLDGKQLLSNWRKAHPRLGRTVLHVLPRGKTGDSGRGRSSNGAGVARETSFSPDWTANHPHGSAAGATRQPSTLQRFFGRFSAKKVGVSQEEGATTYELDIPLEGSFSTNHNERWRRRRLRRRRISINDALEDGCPKTSSSSSLVSSATQGERLFCGEDSEVPSTEARGRRSVELASAKSSVAVTRSCEPVILKEEVARDTLHSHESLENKTVLRYHDSIIDVAARPSMTSLNMGSDPSCIDLQGAQLTNEDPETWLYMRSPKVSVSTVLSESKILPSNEQVISIDNAAYSLELYDELIPTTSAGVVCKPRTQSSESCVQGSEISVTDLTRLVDVEVDEPIGRIGAILPAYQNDTNSNILKSASASASSDIIVLMEEKNNGSCTSLEKISMNTSANNSERHEMHCSSCSSESSSGILWRQTMEQDIPHECKASDHENTDYSHNTSDQQLQLCGRNSNIRDVGQKVSLTHHSCLTSSSREFASKLINTEVSTEECEEAATRSLSESTMVPEVRYCSYDPSTFLQNAVPKNNNSVNNELHTIETSASDLHVDTETQIYSDDLSHPKKEEKPHSSIGDSQNEHRAFRISNDRSCPRSVNKNKRCRKGISISMCALEELCPRICTYCEPHSIRNGCKICECNFPRRKECNTSWKFDTQEVRKCKRIRTQQYSSTSVDHLLCDSNSGNSSVTGKENKHRDDVGRKERRNNNRYKISSNKICHCKRTKQKAEEISSSSSMSNVTCGHQLIRDHISVTSEIKRGRSKSQVRKVSLHHVPCSGDSPLSSTKDNLTQRDHGDNRICEGVRKIRLQLNTPTDISRLITDICTNVKDPLPHCYEMDVTVGMALIGSSRNGKGQQELSSTGNNTNVTEPQEMNNQLNVNAGGDDGEDKLKSASNTVSATATTETMLQSDTTDKYVEEPPYCDDTTSTSKDDEHSLTTGVFQKSELSNGCLSTCWICQLSTIRTISLPIPDKVKHESDYETNNKENLTSVYEQEIPSQSLQCSGDVELSSPFTNMGGATLEVVVAKDGITSSKKNCTARGDEVETEENGKAADNLCYQVSKDMKPAASFVESTTDEVSKHDRHSWNSTEVNGKNDSDLKTVEIIDIFRNDLRKLQWYDCSHKANGSAEFPYSRSKIEGFEVFDEVSSYSSCAAESELSCTQDEEDVSQTLAASNSHKEDSAVETQDIRETHMSCTETLPKDSCTEILTKNSGNSEFSSKPVGVMKSYNFEYDILAKFIMLEVLKHLKSTSMCLSRVLNTDNVNEYKNTIDRSKNSDESVTPNSKDCHTSCSELIRNNNETKVIESDSVNLQRNAALGVENIHEYNPEVEKKIEYCRGSESEHSSEDSHVNFDNKNILNKDELFADSKTDGDSSSLFSNEDILSSGTSDRNSVDMRSHSSVKSQDLKQRERQSSLRPTAFSKGKLLTVISYKRNPRNLNFQSFQKCSVEARARYRHLRGETRAIRRQFQDSEWPYGKILSAREVQERRKIYSRNLAWRLAHRTDMLQATREIEKRELAEHRNDASRDEERRISRFLENRRTYRNLKLLPDAQSAAKKISYKRPPTEDFRYDETIPVPKRTAIKGVLINTVEKNQRLRKSITVSETLRTNFTSLQRTISKSYDDLERNKRIHVSERTEKYLITPTRRQDSCRSTSDSSSKHSTEAPGRVTQRRTSLSSGRDSVKTNRVKNSIGVGSNSQKTTVKLNTTIEKPQSHSRGLLDTPGIILRPQVSTILEDIEEVDKPSLCENWLTKHYSSSSFGTICEISHLDGNEQSIHSSENVNSPIGAVEEPATSALPEITLEASEAKQLPKSIEMQEDKVFEVNNLHASQATECLRKEQHTNDINQGLQVDVGYEKMFVPPENLSLVEPESIPNSDLGYCQPVNIKENHLETVQLTEISPPTDTGQQSSMAHLETQERNDSPDRTTTASHDTMDPVDAPTSPTEFFSARTHQASSYETEAIVSMPYYFPVIETKSAATSPPPEPMVNGDVRDTPLMNMALVSGGLALCNTGVNTSLCMLDTALRSLGVQCPSGAVSQQPSSTAVRVNFWEIDERRSSKVTEVFETSIFSPDNVSCVLTDASGKLKEEVVYRSVATQWLRGTSVPDVAMKAHVNNSAPKEKRKRRGTSDLRPAPAETGPAALNNYDFGVNHIQMEHIRLLHRRRLFRAFSTNSLALGTNEASTQKVMRRLFKKKRRKAKAPSGKGSERKKNALEAAAGTKQERDGVCDGNANRSDETTEAPDSISQNTGDTDKNRRTGVDRKEDRACVRLLRTAKAAEQPALFEDMDSVSQASGSGRQASLWGSVQQGVLCEGGATPAAVSEVNQGAQVFSVSVSGEHPAGRADLGAMQLVVGGEDSTRPPPGGGSVLARLRQMLTWRK